MRKTMAAAVAVIALTACADIEGAPKQTAGTLLGAGLGALAGSQIGGGKGQLAAVAVGTLAGAWLGGEAGKSLDRADRAYAQRTTQRSLEGSPTGTISAWRNPDTGHSGTVIPVRNFTAGDGTPGRVFEATVDANGKTEKITGEACRQPDGSWRILG